MEQQMVKLMVALQPDDKVLLQIMQDDKALAHVILDRASALSVSEQIKKLAEKISESADHH